MVKRTNTLLRYNNISHLRAVNFTWKKKLIDYCYSNFLAKIMNQSTLDH